MQLTNKEVKTLLEHTGNLDLSDVDTDNVDSEGALTLLWALTESSAPVSSPQLRPIVRKLANQVSEEEARTNR